MDIQIKNRRKIIKLGRGLGVFLAREAKSLGWTNGTPVSVVVFKDGKKRGILIER